MTFSQRNNLESLPSQLKLGEVPRNLRNFIFYEISREFDRKTLSGYNGSYFPSESLPFAADLHVYHFGLPISTLPSAFDLRNLVERIIQSGPPGPLFDLVEFLLAHQLCSADLKIGIAKALAAGRAAYRICDGLVVAIGTEEQAAAFERAIADTETDGASAARKHLIASGVALRIGDWPGSVRESIHAVESVAKRLAPDAVTLGDALKSLERRGLLQGKLKAAFDTLYTYSNADENGARHALVYDDESKVDETDALFMLGACASFVSWLSARGRQSA